MFIPASPVLSLRLNRQPLTDWLPRGIWLLLSSGRVALYEALRRLNMPQGSAVLIPAYLCRSVLLPFLAYKCRPIFFSVDMKFQPDLEEMTRLIDIYKPKVLLIIHYFGFPMPGFNEIIELCRKSGIYLIEDCAHALFSSDGHMWLGSIGDAAIFSFRKSLSLPEGGLLVLRQGQIEDDRPLLKLSEVIGLGRELAYLLEFMTGFSLRNYLLCSNKIRRKVNDRCELVLGGMSQIGWISHFLLRHIDAKAIIKTRRANFSFLLAHRDDLPKGWRLLIEDLPEGVCPVGFPVWVPHRDEVQKKLYLKGVAVRVFWDTLPDEVLRSGDRFQEAIALSNHILVLPVHQSLSEVHLMKLLKIIRSI